MSLTKKYVLPTKKLKDLFARIREGQAPDKFTLQYLKDLGFRGSNDRAFLPLLKELKFLTQDGVPTQRYNEYRSEVDSKRVIAEALHETYGDLFKIKEKPTEKDKQLIKGKFKSTHNATDTTADAMTATFYSLLALADLDALDKPKPSIVGKMGDLVGKESERKGEGHDKAVSEEGERKAITPTLHYSIQIHLPPTKDIEVYNAIFKSIKEYLFD